MESSAEVWRTKVTNKKSKQNAKPKSDKKPKKMSNGKDSKSEQGLGDVESVCANISSDCCACVGAIAAYLKELLRCLCVGGKVSDSRFGEILCEMLCIGGSLCTDCYNFVKCILHKLCLMNKN